MCDTCGYVYKVSKHDGVIPEDQPEGWECPRCSADRDHFQIVVPSDELDEPEDDEEDIDVSKKVIAGHRLAHIKPTNPDVSALLKRWNRRDLDLQPKFQRYDVWTDKIRSALIESILLELPIPTIYLAENEAGKFVVVDGQQRLNAIFKFIQNEYRLKGLTALKTLNGKTFSELPEPLQQRIEDRALDVTEIYKETDQGVKFSLFERLNRGSVKLNDQELRNCVYRGDYNDFVVRLADNPILKRALHVAKGKKHPRMVDSELTLRFLAFYEQTYLKHPDKKTSEFLNRQMELGENADEKTMRKQEKAFGDALHCAEHIYGEKIFRRFKPGDATDPNGDWEPRINRALMDVVLYTFAQYPKSDILAHSDAIREATIELMSNEMFADLITHTISGAERVKRRFEMFGSAIGRVITSVARDPKRAYKQSTKKSMFGTSNICTLCGNQIMLIDDAHVDHRQPHSMGGKTTLKNSGLAHRYCNQSAGAKRTGRGGGRGKALRKTTRKSVK